jgi:hypothetical protein
VTNKTFSPAEIMAALRRAQAQPVRQATYTVCKPAKARGDKKPGVFNPMLRSVAPGSVR